MFAKYRDNKLVIIDSMTQPEDTFMVPESTIGGFSKEYYNDDFSLKSLECLVKDGIVKLEPTQKISESGIIVDKTDFELMQDGIKEIPKGMKLGKESLERKTLDEQLSDKEITEEEYVILLENEKTLLQRRIKPLCQEQLTKLDWKVLKYQEQQVLLSNNIPVHNPLTTEQYIQILTDKQTYRDLSNYAEMAVNDIKTEQELKDAKVLFSLDFTDIEVVRNLTNDFRNIYGE